MFTLGKVLNYFKSFVFAPFILFLFDKMAIGLNVFIPINVLTILIIGFLGIPGLIMLIAIYFMLF